MYLDFFVTYVSDCSQRFLFNHNSFINAFGSKLPFLNRSIMFTTTQISDFDYPSRRMYCPIMSVIFGKVLYLISQKMPSKRYGRLRGDQVMFSYSARTAGFMAVKCSRASSGETAFSDPSSNWITTPASVSILKRFFRTSLSGWQMSWQ